MRYLETSHVDGRAVAEEDVDVGVRLHTQEIFLAGLDSIPEGIYVLVQGLLLVDLGIVGPLVSLVRQGPRDLSLACEVAARRFQPHRPTDLVEVEADPP